MQGVTLSSVLAVGLLAARATAQMAVQLPPLGARQWPVEARGERARGTVRAGRGDLSSVRPVAAAAGARARAGKAPAGPRSPKWRARRQGPGAATRGHASGALAPRRATRRAHRPARGLRGRAARRAAAPDAGAPGCASGRARDLPTGGRAARGPRREAALPRLSPVHGTKRMILRRRSSSSAVRPAIW